MKISAGILVVNGGPFIEPQLKNLYDVVHEIVICEGGDDFWFQKHGYRRSIDNTIDIIKSFPDPDRKIKLIQKDWKNKNEMSHEFSRHFTGDIAYNVDIDEFLVSRDLVEVCNRLLKSNCNELIIPHYVFYGDFNTILVMEHSDTWMQVPRIYKNSKNYLINHLPMGYYNPKTGNLIGSVPLKVSDIFIHHYSWIYPKWVREKLEYYEHRIPGCIRNNWYETYFHDFENKKQLLIQDQTNIRPTDGPKQFIKPFMGKQLEIAELIRKNILSET